MRNLKSKVSSLLLLLISSLSAQSLDTLRASWDQVLLWEDGSVMSDPLVNVHHYDIYIRPVNGGVQERINASPIIPIIAGRVSWSIKKRFESGSYSLTVIAWGSKEDPTNPKESGHSLPVIFTIPSREIAPAMPSGITTRVKPARN